MPATPSAATHQNKPSVVRVCVGIGVLCGLAAVCGAQPMVAPPAGETAAAPSADYPQAVGPLVSDLLLQVDLVYQGQPKEIRRRRDAVQQAMAAWRASRRTAADTVRLSAWLREALRASMPGAEAAMPPAPDFLTTRSTAAAPRPSVPPQDEAVVVATPAPDQSPPGSQRPREAEAAPSPVEPRPAEPRTAEPRTAEPRTVEPRTAAGPPRPTASSPRNAARPAETYAASRPAPSTPAPQPADPRRADPQTKTDAVQAAPRSPARAGVARDAAPGTRKRIPADRFAGVHPAASQLDWSNPFVDDPLPATPPQERTAAVVVTGDEPRAAQPAAALMPESLRTAARQRTARKPPAVAPGVRVNLTELGARIRGYSRALRAVEAGLLSEPAANGFQLAGLARELETLAPQRELIDLYLGVLPEIERMAIDGPPPAEPVVALLASLATNRSQAVAGADTAAATAERAVLRGLTRRLSRLLAEQAEG
ncbi:MAG: hypothetical protein AAF790_01895 [Planctomycetota bacterium]